MGLLEASRSKWFVAAWYGYGEYSALQNRFGLSTSQHDKVISAKQSPLSRTSTSTTLVGALLAAATSTRNVHTSTMMMLARTHLSPPPFRAKRAHG
eukprot:6907225-Prymnesium_polylepis.1